MTVGRNDPCPCGSGKKYKQCCGSQPVPADAPPASVDPVTRAYELFQQGDLAAADKACQKVLKREPERVDALHLSGLCQYQLWKYRKAEKLLQQAVSRQDTDPWLHNNLGLALQAQDKLEAAHAHYERAQALQPAMLEARNNLGNVLKAMHRLDDARSCFETVLTMSGQQDAAAHYNLGTVLQAQGDYEQALAHYQQVVELGVESADVHNNLGAVYRQLERTSEAMAQFQRAHQLDPHDADILTNLGFAHIDQCDFEEAGNYFLAALEFDPEYVMALKGMGDIHFHMSHWVRARDTYKKALRLDAHNPKVLHSLAETLLNIDHITEAEKAIQQALAVEPGEHSHHALLASIYWRQARYDEAVSVYQDYLEQYPDCAEIYLAWAHNEEVRNNLAKAGELVSKALELAQGSVDEHLLRASALLLRARITRRKRAYEDAAADLQQLDPTRLPAQKQAEYYFEKADLCDRQTRYDEAFDAYSQANQLVARLRYVRFDRQAQADRISEIKTTLTPAILSQLPGYQGNPDEQGPQPLFIVGFPRSGTTLVEQILCSHSRVTAGGELWFLPELWGSQCQQILGSGKSCPACLCDPARPLQQQDLARLREYYLASAAALGLLDGDNPWFTDKLPLNMQYLPLIKMLFPSSPIIHVRRYPLDTCLSAFFQNFAQGHEFAHDIHDTAFFYDLVMDLVAYYETHLEMCYLAMRYEDLVQDQETITRQLLDFVGLPWEEQCLQFHQSGRVARTASYAQVSQQLYSSSLHRSHHYLEHLREVVPMLAAVSRRFGYESALAEAEKQLASQH